MKIQKFNKVCIIFVLSLLIALFQAKSIDLGYVGKSEVQHIQLSSLFDSTITKEDTFKVTNNPDYPDLLALDEESKEEETGYTHFKLTTKELKEKTLGEQTFELEVTKEPSNDKRTISFTILNNLNNFIDISALREQSLKVSKSFFEGTFTELDINKGLVKGNNIKLDIDSSDPRLQLRHFDEYSLKLVGEPEQPKKERDPAQGYVWKFLQTENYAVRYDDFRYKMWIYKCQKPDIRFKTKTCLFIKIVDLAEETMSWLIEILETQDSLLMVFKGFGKTLRFRKMNLITEEIIYKEIISTSYIDDFKLYRYGNGWFFTTEDQLFNAGVHIHACYSGEFEDFKKIGFFPSGLKNSYKVSTNISSENQKIILYVRNFSGYDSKIQGKQFMVQKYDLSEIREFEEIKPILESKPFKFDDQIFNDNAATCTMHERTFIVQFQSTILVSSMGFKATDRVINYQVKDLGITGFVAPQLQCFPNLNKILVRVQLAPEKFDGKTDGWLLINADPNAESSEWIDSLNVKTSNQNVKATTYSTQPTGLKSSASDSFFVLGENINGDYWRTYYLRLNGATFYLDLTKSIQDKEESMIDKVKLRFTNAEQYQELDFNINRRKKTLTNKITIQEDKTITQLPQHKEASLEEFFKISGDNLQAKLISIINDKEKPFDINVLSFINRINLVNQFEVTQKVIKVDRIVEVKSTLPSKSFKILGFVRDEIYLFEVSKDENKVIKYVASFKDVSFYDILSIEAHLFEYDLIELLVSDYSGTYSDRVTYYQLDLKDNTVKLNKRLDFVGGQKTTLVPISGDRLVITHNERENKLYYQRFNIYGTREIEAIISDVTNFSWVHLQVDGNPVLYLVYVKVEAKKQSLVYRSVNFDTGILSNSSPLKQTNKEDILLNAMVKDLNCGQTSNKSKIQCVLLSSETSQRVLTLAHKYPVLEVETVQKFELYKSHQAQLGRLLDDFFVVSTKDLESSNEKLIFYSLSSPTQAFSSLSGSDLALEKLNIQDILQVKDVNSKKVQIAIPAQNQVTLINLYELGPYSIKSKVDNILSGETLSMLEDLVLVINPDEAVKTQFNLKPIFKVSLLGDKSWLKYLLIAVGVLSLLILLAVFWIGKKAKKNLSGQKKYGEGIEDDTQFLSKVEQTQEHPKEVKID